MIFPLCHTNQCAKETNQSVLPSSQVAQMRCIFVILVPTPLSKPVLATFTQCFLCRKKVNKIEEFSVILSHSTIEESNG